MGIKAFDHDDEKLVDRGLVWPREMSFRGTRYLDFQGLYRRLPGRYDVAALALGSLRRAF